MPRYTCTESTDTISIGSRVASSRARFDLPLAVGPSSAYAVRVTARAAAGGVDEAAGSVGGLVGQQPKNRTRHFFGLASAFHGRQLADARHPAGIAALRMDLGMDHPRPHCVDADAFGGDLLGQAHRKRVDSALRRRVIHIVP